MIPFSASSASLTRSVFSSSTLPGAGSVGSAIEIPDTGGEELKEEGKGRAVSLLTGRIVSASGAVV